MPDGAFPQVSSDVGTFLIKRSRYTVLVPLRGGRHLAYHTVSRAFSVWEAQDHALWQALGERGIGANYGAFATLDDQNASGEAHRALVEAGLDVVSTDKPQFVFDALEERQDFAAAATTCMAQ